MELENEHLEDENKPTSTTLEDKSRESSIITQMRKESLASQFEQIEEIIFSEAEETKPQTTQSSCPPKGRFNRWVTVGIIILILLFAIWSISGLDHYPEENLFGLFIVFYAAVLGGKLLKLIRLPSVPPLPPLLGMLLAGFTVRNVPFISQYVNINNKWSSSLRNTALTLILIKAGLGLDPQALSRLKNVCLRLSLGPCLMEACSAAVISHFLMKFPWEWGFLLGFVVGAVSPAVVVPSMLLLQEQGYGVEKGIPTLLVAASSLDDIAAITGFTTLMSIVFSKGTILYNLLTSFRNVVIGILLGTILGIFVRYFPSEDQTHLSLKRACLLLGMCIFAVLGSNSFGIHGAGGLCTLMLTFIGGLSWSKNKAGVQKIITFAWDIFQPLLFGLVGLEVSVESLQSNTIGISVATMSLAVMIRICSTFLLMSFAGFNVKEKIFIALSWMPKATVQAVLGPLALETARISSPHLVPYSKDVMTIAFLAILVTAPNGALFINILGPKLLERHRDPSKIKMDPSLLLH